MYSSSNDDLPTMVEDSSYSSSRHRTGAELTNIKPKPTSQAALQSTSGKNNNGTNQGLSISPFRSAFILSPESGDALFDSDPSAWGDISSFDKAGSLGKNLTLSKLTSPGTTGELLWNVTLLSCDCELKKIA